MKKSKNLVLYFQVHQPRRLRTLRFFDIGANRGYFDDALNGEIIQRVARECYLPANELLLAVIRKHPNVRVAFSISGITLDQFEEYAPEVIDSFRKLARTGCVDFLNETYYHSLACLIPGNEFELQVAKHQKKILQHFGVLTKVFRNTELIYSNDLAARVAHLGFKGVMIDGIDTLLNGRSVHQIFEHAETNIKLLPRDYRLSDEIAFRFSQGTSRLTAARYMSWLDRLPAEENMIHLGMDYETFGEHQKKESGIFDFLEELLSTLAQRKDYCFMTPSEAVGAVQPVEKLSVPGYISWADKERDVSAWLGNDMQRDAFDSLLKMEHDVKMLHDIQVLQHWRSLQTSDHFYYMCTKKGSDGEVHSYFSPYPSPYEAFINYMNVLTDFMLRVKILKAAGIRHNNQGKVLMEQSNLAV